MNKKQLYTAPEADLLVVRFEENIMSPAIDPNGLQQGTIIVASGIFDDWDD